MDGKKHERNREILDENYIEADPHYEFQKWLRIASLQKANEPTAMNLATCDGQGRPSSRIVYLKGFKKKGLLFFTNYLSRKGQDIEVSSYVSLTFFWPELERQVRIEGKARKIPAGESEEYFESRPVASRIGAWVSDQSKIIDSREVLEQRRRYYEKRFTGVRIRRPRNWGGYLVTPDYYEFWQARPGRLHDRLAYFRHKQQWRIRRLAP